MISATEENSPGRSEPRSGGATVAVVIWIGRVGRRLGRFFLFSGRGEDGRLVGGGLGGLVLVWTRKLWRGGCIASFLLVVCGREDVGRLSRLRGRLLQVLGRVMFGWRRVLVREQRRERNSLRVVDRSRHWRYRTAPTSGGGAGGRPRRDRRRENSVSVRRRGGAPLGRYMRWSHVRTPCVQSGVSLWRMSWVGG